MALAGRGLGRALAGRTLRCPFPVNYSALPVGVSRHHPSGVGASVQDSYLVDSASSHMLVSKIKPCMSKYKQLYCETANGSLNQLSFI
jgi:hypothetical protein